MSHHKLAFSLDITRMELLRHPTKYTRSTSQTAASMALSLKLFTSSSGFGGSGLESTAGVCAPKKRDSRMDTHTPQQRTPSSLLSRS